MRIETDESFLNDNRRGRGGDLLRAVGEAHVEFEGWRAICGRRRATGIHPA